MSTDQEILAAAAARLSAWIEAADADNTPRETWTNWMTGGLGGGFGELGVDLVNAAEALRDLLAAGASADGPFAPELVAVARALMREQATS